MKTFSKVEGSYNKCPECNKYSLVQMDNFTAEFVATRYRCEFCLKSFAIHKNDDLDIKEMKKIYH